MSQSVVTAARFAKGMTFDEYVKYVGTPENLAREGFAAYHPDAGSIGGPRKDNSAVFRERYARTKLADHQVVAITWLAAQPDGPAKILVISEDWSSDCRRDVPILQRLAEAGGLELRIFNRDGKKILSQRRPDPALAPDANYDLMLEFMNAKNAGEFASLPAVGIYTKDFRLIHRYLEYPAIYHKDRVRGAINTPKPGESKEQAAERGLRDFFAFQETPFFRIYASAAADEIIAMLHERLRVGSLA